MSIFEPIPRASAWDEETHELEDAPAHDDDAVPGPSLDPRSIVIAGFAVLAIVITGLLVSNMARPESRPQPLVPSHVDPGAAAVEQAEAQRPVPTAAASASPSAEPVDEAQQDPSTDDARTWQARGGSKRDDKPSKGHGHGRG